MKRYADFDLLVDSSGKGYLVRVFGSPAGEASAKILPRVAADLEKLHAALARLPPLRSEDRTAVRLARELGGKLYRALFHEEVGRILAASLDQTSGRGEGLRIKLRLARVPEIARWPWELLYNPMLDRFLALSADTPIVRYPDLSERPRAIETRLPLSVLVVIASPADRPRLRADRELERIEKAVAPLVASGQALLDSLPSATLPALAERLRQRDVHVLHFIGHGAFDAENAEGVLALEDEKGRADPVSAHRLATLFLDHPNLRLVFLNACEGARHDEYDAFSGVAQRLLQQRVPAVVAMQREISDRAAIAFSARFYGALTVGAPVDMAVSKGRRAVLQEGLGIQWSAPALYLRAPDGVLFDLAPQIDTSSSVAPIEPPAESLAPAPHRARAIAGASTAALLLFAGALAFFARDRSRSVAFPGSVRQAPVPEAAPLPRSSLPVPPADKTPTAPRLHVEPPGQQAVPSKVPKSRTCPSPASPEILFVRIEPGSFEMGSAHGKNKKERPVHQVTLTRAYCLGAYEITEGQWEAVMGDAPPATYRERTMPKVEVTWDDVQRFLARLNDHNPGCRFFSPTEAQWEYAARAGSSATYGFGDDPKDLHQYANCFGRGQHPAMPIGTLSPNVWGLYDMEGNVSEWVADRDGDYPDGPVTDPSGPAEGERRVRRGGSSETSVENCRPAYRTSSPPGYRRKDIGFRIAATPLP